MKLDEHRYFINNWIFDFKNMMVQDQRNWSLHKGSYRRIDWQNGKIFILSTINRGQYRTMFLRPEEHFNLAINEAYTSYVFEQEVLCKDYEVLAALETKKND